jgi:hypothetical protein
LFTVAVTQKGEAALSVMQLVDLDVVGTEGMRCSAFTVSISVKTSLPKEEFLPGLSWEICLFFDSVLRKIRRETRTTKQRSAISDRAVEAVCVLTN